MYYAGTLKSNPRFHCIGVAKSTHAQGPYIPVGDDPWICPDIRSHGGAIDPDGFFDRQLTKRYVTYKEDTNSIGFGGSCNNGKSPILPTRIMLQEVGEDGITKIGFPVEILDRDEADGPLIENPSLALSDQGVYFLFYSSNCFTTPLYATSYATAPRIEGPYEKASRPLLITGDGPNIVGPGGLDIIADGQTVVFHGQMTVKNDPVMAEWVKAEANKLKKPFRNIATPFVRGMYSAVASFNDREVSLEKPRIEGIGRPDVQW
jgi:Glycosyl hydrolases family 43